MSGKILGNKCHNSVRCVCLKVIDLMTLSADKMIVRVKIAVKMIRSVFGGNTVDFTQTGQQGKITVNGAEADIRELLSEAGIYSISSGMFV